MIFTLVVAVQHKGVWKMLSNARRVQMCYSLLSYMLTDQRAQDFGFATNAADRIFLAYTNQIPRPENKTVMFFTIKDEAYKQARSDPHHYTRNNVEVLEQMRQIRLTVDVYSKIVPTGNANDVVRWLNTALISDMFEDWVHDSGWNGVNIERIEIMPDLSHLVEGQVWNERAQLIIYLNYRDTTEMAEVPMTRRPLDMEDLRNSINYQVILMNLQTNEGDISDQSVYVGTGIYVTRGDDSNAMGYQINIEIDTSLSLEGWTARFQLEDMAWDFDDITSKNLPLIISAEQSRMLPVGTSYGAMVLYDENGLRKTVMRNIPVYIYPQLVSERTEGD